VHVLIIGASKGIGLETTRQALDAGHNVRALARSAAAIDLSNHKLERVRGDALKTKDVEAALTARPPLLRLDPGADRGDEGPRCQTFDLCDRLWRWR
jgi:NAD(P)-dependent dehydrogenase (short-subunit alcohol dehydrogenase family)